CYCYEYSNRIIASLLHNHEMKSDGRERKYPSPKTTAQNTNEPADLKQYGIGDGKNQCPVYHWK
ncbi:MAG TPA: hypothetical protein VGE32_03000, partial [Cellvibrio sp.]